MFLLKDGLVRSGVRKADDHFPAVVTEVSWPSDARLRGLVFLIFCFLFPPLFGV